MSELETAAFVVSVTAGVGLCLYAILAREPFGAVPAGAVDNDRTPLDRPSMNAENGPLVAVVYRLGDLIEENGRGTADKLRDIARTVQLAPEKVSDIQRERLAHVVDEHGSEYAGIARLGAQHIRESGT